MSPRPLNATAASLLGFLHDGPLTGWDLVAVAQQRIGNFWTLTQSQVYRELAAMAAAGLVALGEPGPRDSKPYSITEAGRAAFADWIEREPGREQIRFPLLLSVAFAAHLPPGRLGEILAAHREAHEGRLADYRRLRSELVAALERMQSEASGPSDVSDVSAVSDSADALRHQLATLEFGLRYESAVVDWFEALPAVLAIDP